MFIDNLSSSLCIYEENDAREVECVVVGEAELVDDCVQEAQAGLIVESLHDLLEGVHGLTVLLDARFLLACLMSDEQDHSTDHV